VYINIADRFSNLLTLYPNSTSGKVTLSGSNLQLDKVKIFNSTGLDVSNSLDVKQESSNQVFHSVSTLLIPISGPARCSSSEERIILNSLTDL
jgi:hypothetical protein